MAAIEKVKVLVLGDSGGAHSGFLIDIGVGKTSLTHLIAHNEPISNPSWTVGCSVEVKLHEFREGTQYQKTYFIELWDVGGSRNHRNTRTTFYNGVHGIILVHDLTNRKSQQNLKYWLSEVVNRDSYKVKSGYEEYDSEQCAGSNMLPMIFIGTKLDLAGEKRVQGNMTGLDIAQEWGADKINLDTMDLRSLAPGSSSAVKLSRFFDKVIEMRYHKREHVSPFAPDKKRFYTSISPNSTKTYHYD